MYHSNIKIHYVHFYMTSNEDSVEDETLGNMDVEVCMMTQLIVLLIGVTSALGFFAISVGVCLLEKYPKASQTVVLEKTRGVSATEDQWANSPRMERQPSSRSDWQASSAR